MAGHDVENALTVLVSAAGFDALAENGLLAAIVHTGRECAPVLANRPACEAARHLLHVLLCVSPIDPQGVEFEEFAGIVLIQTGGALARLATQESGDTDRQLSR